MYTVLLTENDAVCCVLETAFAGECIVHTEKDFEVLTESLKREPADLVIVDLDLPGSREEKTVAALQSLAKKSVILFTADHQLFDPSHPLTAVPAADYLLRPYTEAELLLTLEAAFYACDQKKRSAEAAADESLRLSLVREKIERYICEHYAEDISMQSVAQVMNYSETHFCRLFKQCFKVNFSAYLNEFRIEQAKSMLVSSNRNVKEIALGCGYQDTSYFIRVFKRFTNMTPADYRIYAQSMSRK